MPQPFPFSSGMVGKFFVPFDLDRLQTDDDRVEILFEHASGNLNALLLDANGNTIRYSMSMTDNEYISLRDLDAGTYYLKVFGNDGETNQYSLKYNFNSVERYTAQSGPPDFDPARRSAIFRMR